jgi:hypothetical protein
VTREYACMPCEGDTPHRCQDRACTCCYGEPLTRWLEHLGIEDCTCRFAWTHVGGTAAYAGPEYGWHRQNDAKSCPHHGKVSA